MHISTGKAEARVPALRGLALPAAVDRLEATGLKAGAVERSYSTKEPAGHVLAQSPPAGMVVRKPWRVRLTVSLGPVKAPVPRLEGMNRGSALAAIRRSGFEIGNIVFFPDPYAPPNTVVAQTPEADTTSEESPTIGLLVAEAAPPADKSSVMPNFVGKSYAAAAEAARGAGFKLEETESHIASVGKRPSSKFGTVVAQTPAAGSRILAGATIRLTVQP
jgi:serine/threonine-protein kinase